MSRLANVMHDARGGIFATNLPKDDLRYGLTQPDLVFLDLDGAQIGTVKQFLVALGEQLRVPDLAEAEDWDYLDECLVDLDEFPTAESFVVFFDQFQRLAMAEPGKWKTILEVFAHAVKEGQSRQKPMYIFLRGQPPPQGIPLIDKV
jgi:barstar (barnase inhibitor)